MFKLEQFKSYAENIHDIVCNIRHLKWTERDSGVVSSYMGKLLEVVRRFQRESAPLLGHFAETGRFALYESIACNLIEAYSLIQEIDESGHRQV